MKKLLFLLVLAAGLSTPTQAQVDNLSALLEEGYSVLELENIFSNITVKNQKRWLEGKGFKLVNHFQNVRMYHYAKNSVVNLGVYYDRHEANISEVLFHSSPQKYYMARSGLEENASFRKISEENVTTGDKKGTMTKWAKNGHIYYARDDQWKIGMYRDQNNESAKSYSAPSAAAPASKAANPPTTSSSSSSATAATYSELSSPENIAAYLNKNLYQAYLMDGKTEYKFSTLGRIDFDSRSLAIVTKNGRLYVKMNIPRNGECDYGLKEELLKLVWGETVTTTSYVTENGVEVRKVREGHKFEYDYSCNGDNFNRLVLVVPQKSSDFWSALRRKLDKN